MECNKDEAARAKEISEKKFEANDYVGSQKFALKAHALYPTLAGILEMLMGLNVYIAAGEKDWYKMLDVNPQADKQTIRKQYRKLCLDVHPDKNNWKGANGAFNHVKEAWNVLSDNSKRYMYDRERNIKVVNLKIPTNGSTDVGTSKEFSTTPKTKARKSKSAEKRSSVPKGTSTAAPNQQTYPTNPTFWTVCHRCRLQHEYLRMYVERNLLCPKCQKPFYSFEYPPPTLPIPKITPQANPFEQKQGDNIPVFSSSSGSQWNPFRKMGDTSSADNELTEAQILFEKQRLVRENTLNAMKKGQEAELKRKISSVDLSASKRKKVVEGNTSTFEAFNGGKSKNNKPRSSKDLSNSGIPKILLSEKAKGEIRKNLNEQKSSNTLVNLAGDNKKMGAATANGN